MSLKQHKELSRRGLGIWGAGSREGLEEVFAANYTNHQEPDVEGGVSTKNLAEYKELLSDFHDSFADTHIKFFTQIAEGDEVATRWQMSATQTGDFRGIKATGKEVTWTGVQIDRIKDGKIVESWVDWDKYGLFEGLGLVK